MTAVTADAELAVAVTNVTYAPVDTDQYIYRYVTTFAEDAGMGVPVVYSELRQIGIRQP